MNGTEGKGKERICDVFVYHLWLPCIVEHFLERLEGHAPCRRNSSKMERIQSG